MIHIIRPIEGAVLIVLLVIFAQWIGTPSVPPAAEKKCVNVTPPEWKPEQRERIAPAV